MTRPLVIIGTGLAGYSLAREWRQLDTERPLVMLTADDGAFYSKPMLSNALAQGKAPESLAMKTAATMAADLSAEIATGVKVSAIDPAAGTLACDGTTVEFGDLALAVGARPVRVPVEGDAGGDFLTVNNLSDYARFRERLEGVSSVAVMGPGLIGCEFANDLLSRGIQVDVFGPDPWPVSTLLPEPAGRALQAALERSGVRFHLGTTAQRVERRDGRYTVHLGNGHKIEAGLLLSAVGLRADTTLAAEAGLAIGRGVITGRQLETSAPGIYALGDCAEVAGLNLPFVMPIMHGARALARTLAGTPTPVSYPAMPVAIKTPALATVVAPPARDAAGEWQHSGTDENVRSVYLSPAGEMLGFALTGDAAAEKQALAKQLPPVL